MCTASHALSREGLWGIYILSLFILKTFYVLYKGI